MKKPELQAEIDRLTLRLNVLQERIVALESRMWVIPSLPYQPFAPFEPYRPVCEGEIPCGS
jgi:hypothetical protein